MRFRPQDLFTLCLLILMAILLAMAFLLNRNHYRMGIQSIRGSLQEDLIRGKKYVAKHSAGIPSKALDSSRRDPAEATYQLLCR